MSVTSPSTESKPSTWLANSLAQAGVTHVFFVDAILRDTLIELERAGVRPMLAHTEKAAAYMADGYARVSGRPGHCWAQSVGAANLAAGLQDAWLAQSPVIAMTGRKAVADAERNPYQEIDHTPAFKPVTRMTAQVDSAATLPRLLRQAWRMAMAGNPRPVHLDLPGLMAETLEAGTMPADVGSLPAQTGPASRPEPDRAELEQAVRMLRGARKVAIVAGSGATWSKAGPELLRLAELLKAPIATTLGARGIIPTRHELAVGTIGSYGAEPANRVVHGADLVLVVGSQLSDQVTHHWRIPAPGAALIQIDIDPHEPGRNYANTAPVVGDPKVALARLAEMLGAPERDGAFVADAQAQMAVWRLSMQAACTSDSVPVKVERLCAEITKVLPADAILVADTGYSGIWTCTMIDFNGDGQTYLRAGGSLGWSFPAAIGAKCAAPGRKVVCFTGDGGFYYHLAELETARRNQLPLVVVVNNNSGFGQGWVNMRARGKTPEEMGSIAAFGPTDFAAIAQAFGVRGVRVTDPAQLAPALEAALACNEVVVIDVVTAIDGRPPEAWLPAAK